jgi:hypothetical protein
MNNRPLSQLKIKELQSLLRSLQNSTEDNRDERFRINRIATALNLPQLGEKSVGAKTLSTKIECENNFYMFVKTAFGVVEPGTEFIGNWHIETICNHLDALLMGELQNLIINIPPGTMKSFLTSVLFPAWVWIHDPTQRFMYASYDQTLSTRDSVACRMLIESEWYRANWGDRLFLTSDQNQKTKFMNNHSGWRLATSTGGRGMGEHPHWLMVDDPNDTRKGCTQTEQMQVNEHWWDGAMSTRGRRLKGHHRVVVQQRVHPADLTGHIMKKYGGDTLHLKDPGKWQHLRLPMKYEAELHCSTPIFEDPRQGKPDGTLLWEAGFSDLLVQALELDMGPIVAAGQLQQRPTVAGGTLFRMEWLKTIEPMRPEWLAPVFNQEQIEHVELTQ